MTPDDFRIWLRQPARPPLVMGVLNVTPDSFSDGGQWATPEAAIAHAEQMAAGGADLIDIGGESTRPGAEAVSAEEQIRRVVPIIRALNARAPMAISIDTMSARVAEAALEAGAFVVNDISAGREDAGMLPLVARRGAPIIFMHMLGRPATMQQAPTYNDVTAEVGAFLRERLAGAVRIGIEPWQVLLDPGIGFGKTVAHNLELLRRLGELADLGRPLVVGTSRKAFIGKVTGESEPSRRVFGTAATVAWSITNGAAIVRVHDVGPMAQVVRMVRAIQTG